MKELAKKNDSEFLFVWLHRGGLEGVFELEFKNR